MTLIPDSTVAFIAANPFRVLWKKVDIKCSFFSVEKKGKAKWTKFFRLPVLVLCKYYLVFYVYFQICASLYSLKSSIHATCSVDPVSSWVEDSASALDSTVRSPQRATN